MGQCQSALLGPINEQAHLCYALKPTQLAATLAEHHGASATTDLQQPPRRVGSCQRPHTFLQRLLHSTTPIVLLVFVSVTTTWQPSCASCWP
jgi:hypothetical protein